MHMHRFNTPAHEANGRATQPYIWQSGEERKEMSKGYFTIRTMMAVGAMVVLAACGGTGNNSAVPANSSVESGTPAATSGAATGAEGTTGTGATGSEGANTAGEGNTGADAMATAAPTQPSMESGAATSGDTGTGSTGTIIGTATPDASASGATTSGTPPTSNDGSTGAMGTPLTGPNISFGGVTFDIDTASMPSVTAMSGAVNQMMGGATGSGATGSNTTEGAGTTGMAGSGMLSGTVFTFQGMNMMGNAGTTGNGAATGDAMAGTTGLFQPRIVVIPVSQLVSYEASMMAGAGMTGTTGSDTSGSGTTGSTDATGTATPAASTSGSTSGSTTDQGITDDLFISELSRTLASQSAFPSTSMANSLVLTRALSLLGFGGYTPAFQSNGEFVDFQNGRGVRFVTAFQQEGGMPSALNSVYYLFHGLTEDNQHYVMALMPLQSSVIGMGMGAGATSTGSTSGSTTAAGTATPAAGSSTTMTDTAGMGAAGSIQFPAGGDASAYQSYLDQVVAGLDQAAGGSSDAAFSQSLAQYDTLIESLNVAEGAQ
jgi:hypothetical protein